jgi:hypothetical protein
MSKLQIKDLSKSSNVIIDLNSGETDKIYGGKCWIVSDTTGNRLLEVDCNSYVPNGYHLESTCTECRMT